MAKNITLMGADYPQVPAVQLPQTGGGTATFYDIQVIDNLNSDSSTDALSAKQGKELKNMMDTSATLLSDCYNADDPRKVYYANGTTANRPTGADWWFLRCAAKSGSMKFLIAYKMNVVSPVIYACSFSNTGSTNGWVKIFG